MTSNSLRTETAYGVDGCRKGWFYFALVPGREPGWGVVARMADLVAEADDSDRIFIDIPIGLPNGGEGRLCDTEARQKLAPYRTSSVFPVPVRSALTAETYEEASEKNWKASGKRLSKQTYAIMPKIREVDSLLRGSARARRVVREVHPEICFWALAGGSPMRHNKKTRRGFDERVAVLERFHPATVGCFDEIRTGHRPSDLADDDILDGMALAITASANRGALRTLPELPVEDSCGLPMEMVYAPASAFAMRDYPEEVKLGGAETITELVDRVHRSLDELVEKGMRQGIEQAIRQGRTQVLRRLMTRRFGEETAGRLSMLLEELSDAEGIDKVADALIECGTAEEFIERVRTA